MLLATDLADYLVRRGVPFRKAHELVGRAVALCGELKCSLPEIPLAHYLAISPDYGADLYEVFDLAKAMSARKAIGAPSPENVTAQLERWKTRLSEAR
jgi:argininosuccinate lyase